jgi:hypothetical protein
MVANHDNMLDTFNLCNMEYFGGELMFPEFELLHSKNTCGYFKYTKGGWFDHTLYDPIIMMTDYYDFTDSQYRDIMCHEMIHYYLAYTGVDRNCHHGKEFKKMADQLNLNYGLHITKRLDVSKYKKRKRGRVVMSRFSSNNNQVRFFKEAWGFLFEFNSIGEYLSFLLGRVIGVVIFVGILFLIFWFL